MSINLTLVNELGSSITTTTVQSSDNLSVLASAATQAFGIPPGQLLFLHDGVPQDPDETFANARISDGDLIVVTHLPAQTDTAAQGANNMPRENAASNLNPNTPSGLDSGTVPSEHDPQQSIPRLTELARQETPQVRQRLLDLLRNIGPNTSSAPRDWPEQGRVSGRFGANARSSNLLDPMSLDGQKAIEEQIRQENINQNMEAALEHNPEAFGRVVMLFVDCKINAASNIKAFIDSGAQMTIISKACAERCGIVNLIDTRFVGTARGVGTAKILGRIHLALMTIGTEVFEITFTVLDSVGGSYDVLLGLDMLRKHQAMIDLKDNCLRIGGISVPFLGEKDIPASMRGEEVDPETMSPMQPPPVTPGTRTGSNVAAPSRPPAAFGAEPISAETIPTEPAHTAVDSEAVQRIEELGFSRGSAERALQMCNGNVERAIHMLVAQRFGL